MLQMKKAFIWVLAVLMVFLAAGCAPADGKNPPVAEVPSELKERYPTFFDLDTSKGLTVYAANFAQNYTVCSLYPTTEEDADLIAVAYGPRTDIATMKMILAAYDLPWEAITVTPYTSVLSSYIAPDLFQDGAIEQLRYELGVGEKPEEVVEEPDNAPFPNAVCWSGYSEEGEHALRYTYYPITGTYAYQNELTYPAIGIKNTQELDSFLSLARNYFSLSASMPNKDTFNTTVKKFDEAFFQEKGIVIVYIPSESTSIRYTLTDATLTGEELYITVAEKRPEGELATEMAGWFMVVELPKETISQANYFSAG